MSLPSLAARLLGRRARAHAHLTRSARVVLICAAVLWLGWRAVRLGVGDPSGELAASTWTEATRVLGRDGRLLGERASASGLRGRPVSLDALSPRLVAATIASEDRAFYSHDGVDRAAIARAFVTNVTKGRVVSGGSTITAQLVKRLDHRGHAHQRTLLSKVIEAARAQNLEATTDKATILEAYFTHLDYGRGLAGPEAAARGYFGVAAADLSLAQAALLAVVPRAPSALDPRRHLDRAVIRQRALLRVMQARGDAAARDVERALAEPITLAPEVPQPLLAPHVVLAASAARERTVRTTLDVDLQRDIEGIARSHVPRLRERGAENLAVVVVDNATGEVLAEVGGDDYFDARRAGAVDLVRAKRQAGSTLKPFVFARAFERGVSPTAALADVPLELGTTGASYAPDNFDGTFAGPVGAREALAASLNVPAVRLAVDLGPKDVVDTLRAVGLGLAEGSERRYGASIALGSAEVSPWELAAAYTTLARGGVKVHLHDRVADAPLGAGPQAEAEHVIDGAAAALVADALSDPFARVRGLRARGAFDLPFTTAVKTGTSTAYRDGWTAGFTRERTVVVWSGNARGAPTAKLTGGSGAGPVFTDVMRRAMRDVAGPAPLFDAALLEEAEVCPLSGEAPTATCPDRVTRRFALGRTPRSACGMHRHARSTPTVASSTAERARPRDVDGGLPPPASCTSGATRWDRTIVALPDSYARFLADLPRGAPGRDGRGLGWYLASSIPACAEGAVDEAIATVEPRVVLVNPRPGAVFRTDDTPASAGRGAASSDAFELRASTEGMARDVTLEVLVDGEARATLVPPYRAFVPIGPGDHAVEVRPRDPKVRGRVARAEIHVR